MPSFKLLYQLLIEPKSSTEDSRRREFILNVLLIGTLLLSATSVLINQVNRIVLGTACCATPLKILVVIFLVFTALYLASRASFYVTAAYGLVGVYFLAATYTVYNWGAENPQALLTYALVIVMSGVLIGTKFSLALTALVSLTLLLIYYLQTNLVTNPDLHWKNDAIRFDDAIAFVATLGIIVVVSWLSNREIDKSLKRARQSEAALKDERDNLEVKVEQRTSELKQAQLEKMMHLYRLAAFGRVASGLFHDLVNPLNVVSLSLENLQGRNKDTKEEINAKRLQFSVNSALAGTKRMERFVEAARRHIRQQQVLKDFSLAQEIEQVLPILDYKARTLQVKINFNGDDDIQLHGDPIKFNQIVTNLIANAIESYEGQQKNRHSRRVEIRLRREDNVAILSVQDWGCGIEPDHLGEIFEPFYTTKDFEKGMGFGLHLVKENVEKEFTGSIIVASKPEQGTTFTITLPLKNKSRRA